MRTAQSRKNAGVAAWAFGIGLAMFLLLFPAAERTHHQAMVREGDLAELPGALRHLCWTEKGKETLDTTVSELPLERRRVVLGAVVDEGCLHRLRPTNQAAHFVFGTGEADIERALGFQGAAIDPAFEALESGDPELQSRGAFVLAALSRELIADQEERARTRLQTLPPGPSRRLLTLRLGAPSEPPAEPDEDESVSSSDVRLMEGLFETVNDSPAAEIDIESFPLDRKLDEPGPKLRRGGVLFRATGDSAAETDEGVERDAADAPAEPGEVPLDEMTEESAEAEPTKGEEAERNAKDEGAESDESEEAAPKPSGEETQPTAKGEQAGGKVKGEAAETRAAPTDDADAPDDVAPDADTGNSPAATDSEADADE